MKHTFTDSDLAGMKKTCGELEGLCAISCDDVLRLISRLEAAEYVAENCVCKGKGHDIARAAWRKGAGKERK